jgi:fibronectin-binding autotransporter adhesin
MTLTGLGGDACVDTAGYNVTLSGPLSGQGGLHKLGNGTLTLNAKETYSGDTTVSGGTLMLMGGIDGGGTSLIDVQAGKAVLGGVNVGKSDLEIVTAAGATFEAASGTHVLGAISGSGITRVDSGAALTAASICQGALIIGAAPAQAPTPVPEPSAWVMLLAALAGGGWIGGGKSRESRVES